MKWSLFGVFFLTVVLLDSFQRLMKLGFLLWDHELGTQERTFWWRQGLWEESGAQPCLLAAFRLLQVFFFFLILVGRPKSRGPDASTVFINVFCTAPECLLKRVPQLLVWALTVLKCLVRRFSCAPVARRSCCVPVWVEPGEVRSRLQVESFSLSMKSDITLLHFSEINQ